MRIAIAAAAACLSIVGVTATAQVHAAIRKHTEIPAEPLDLALHTLAKDRGFQVVYLTEDVRTLQTRGATCDCTIDEALRKLLSDSHLEYKFVDENTVSIFPKPIPTSALEERNGASASVRSEDSSGDSPKSSSERRLRLAQVDQGKSSPPAAVNAASPDSQDQDKAKLEEIVVTGTHIKGVTPVIPVITLGQEDFDRSGYSTVQDAVSSLPQNFSGGVGAGTANVSPNPAASQNIGQVSAINLRGLGPGATLTLLDGHRMAPSPITTVTDISAIPLSAIDRIEVLPDGASAIYGSDAIAGVVNLVLKKDFEGVEAAAQYGATSDGGADENREDLTFGHTWSSGNLIGGYEHYHSNPLTVSERDFSSAVPEPTDLLAETGRNSFFLHVSQDAFAGSSVFLEGLYTKTNSDDLQGAPYSTNTTDDTEALSLTPGYLIPLFGDWTAELDGLYGRNIDKSTDGFLTNEPSIEFDYRSVIESLDLKMDGSLFRLPAGAAKLAVGTGWREESFDLSGDGVEQHSVRQIFNAFAEMNVPIFSSLNSIPGVYALGVDAAVRYEHYTDFGATTNPKVGVSWSPTSKVKLWGSWGTSFRAPTLFEKSEAQNAIIVNEPDPESPTGKTLTVAAVGGNPDLVPETSRTFTAGITVDPIPGLHGTLDYFNTKYEQRIGIVDTNFFTYLANSAIYPSPIVIRNPSLAFVDGVLANSATVLSLVGPYNPANIAAYEDARFLNAASYREDGLDLGLKYGMDIPVGRLTLLFNSAYILKIEQQATSLSPTANLVNTVFYPVKFKFRTSADWSRGGWGTSLSANYTMGYTNNTVTPYQPIDSYTTIDLQGGYTWDSSAGPVLSGLKMSLAIRNVFNTDPPFVKSLLFQGARPFGYDPANADPFGRFITFQIAKRF